MQDLTFKKLREKGSERGAEWNKKEFTPEEKLENLLFRTNELSGEAGELQEVILLMALSLHLGKCTGKVSNASKKFSRGKAGLVGGVDIEKTKQEIREELADVIICADRVAESLGINLEESIINKFNKTSEKYGLKTKIN